MTELLVDLLLFLFFLQSLLIIADIFLVHPFKHSLFLEHLLAQTTVRVDDEGLAVEHLLIQGLVRINR